MSKDNLLDIKEPYGDVDLDMLKDFSEAKGISGHEAGASRVMKKWLEGHADSFDYDNLGSLIALQKGKGRGKRAKVAMFGHIDEVGFYVKKIEEKGFLRVVSAGGFWTPVLMSQEVIVTTREGKEFHGTFGTPSVYMKGKEAQDHIWTIDELILDIGVDSKEEAESLGVRVGDMVTLDTSFRVLANPNYLMGKAWDDRIGAAVAADVLRHLEKKDHTADVYAVGTVQEELGLRGARTAGYAVDPDIAIALDSTVASDIPGYEEFGKPLGSGVTLSIMDGSVVANRELVYFMEDLCRELDIPFVHDILLRGGTDSGEIHKLRSGVINMTISIPTRYIHCHRGIVHRKDVADTVTLLTEFCKRVDWDLVEKFRASNR
ncbi:MAG: M42 family metallopeptidase [Erysipelotrichaceae bacterium]|nr:M42 family metallopeptidase [Erysipelotrichaceae bacterium]